MSSAFFNLFPARRLLSWPLPGTLSATSADYNRFPPGCQPFFCPKESFSRINKAPPDGGALADKFRRRPTFPHSHPCSIIGAAGLNFCVRDGNRCDPCAIATENRKTGFQLLKTDSFDARQGTDSLVEGRGEEILPPAFTKSFLWSSLTVD